MLGRRFTGCFLLVSLSWSWVAFTGCSGDGNPSPGADAPAASERSAATALPIPGSEPPPGHPPLDRARRAERLVWEVPEAWIEEPPSSSMRITQFRVPGKDGDGECVVYHFGAGQGGDPMSNARRWAGQFTQADGGSSLERMRISEVDATRVPVRLVEVTGTYDGGMTMANQPAQVREGHMLLGGIAEGPTGPWFFKFTGPEPTVHAQREAFVRMMQSIRQAD